MRSGDATCLHALLSVWTIKQATLIVMFGLLCMCQQQQQPWHRKQTYSKAPPTSAMMCVYNF